MRVLALDVGDRRIGIAVSDPFGITAQAIESYTRKGDKATFEHIGGIAKRFDAELVVLGLPLNLDGTEGQQAGKVREFAQMLGQETGIAQEFIDERLTTAQAERAMIAADERRGKRKTTIDQVAACLILQGWLDNPRNKERAGEARD